MQSSNKTGEQQQHPEGHTGLYIWLAWIQGCASGWHGYGTVGLIVMDNGTMCLVVMNNGTMCLVVMDMKALVSLIAMAAISQYSSTAGSNAI